MGFYIYYKTTECISLILKVINLNIYQRFDFQAAFDKENFKKLYKRYLKEDQH